MNSTTVFQINKVSIETYDPKTKTKKWNHLSNTNPNGFYEMKVTIDKSDLIFQIYNKADKMDMQLNLKVKYQIHPKTGKAFVSSTTLRMIIKPPIIAFRYNIKDFLNNEIVLKKAQFSISDDLSFQAMIDILVKKGVTLKDSKNRDYTPVFFSNDSYETFYNEFENQILESQVSDCNLNLTSPIEHTKSKKLETLKENIYEIEDEKISYGSKPSQPHIYDNFSVKQNDTNIFKNKNFVENVKNPTKFLYSDQEDINNFKETPKTFSEKLDYLEVPNNSKHFSQQKNSFYERNGHNNEPSYLYQKQHNLFSSNDLGAYVVPNNKFYSDVKEYDAEKQKEDNFSRRNSFYEPPIERIYSEQRRRSIVIPILTQNENSDIIYSNKKVMEQDDIENMMTSVLKNVLPKISDFQKSAEMIQPSEEKKKNNSIAIDTNTKVDNINGLSTEFFLCLDDQTKLGILKNLQFFQALKLLSKCKLDKQKTMFELIGKEVSIPDGVINMLNNKINAPSNNCYTSSTIENNTDISAHCTTPITSAKTKNPLKKAIKLKNNNTESKITKRKRKMSSTPMDLIKKLETWANINEYTVEGEFVGDRFLRRKKEIIPLTKIIETDCKGEISVKSVYHKNSAFAKKASSNVVKSGNITLELKQVEQRSENLIAKEIDSNKTTKLVNDSTIIKDRALEFDKTIEPHHPSTFLTDVAENSSNI